MNPRESRRARRDLGRIYDALETVRPGPEEVDEILRSAGLDPLAVERRLRNVAASALAPGRKQESWRERASVWFDSFLDETAELLAGPQAMAELRSASPPLTTTPSSMLGEEYTLALHAIFSGQYEEADALLGRLGSNAGHEMTWLLWSRHHVLLRQNRIKAARELLERLGEHEGEYGDRARRRLNEWDEPV